VAYLNTLPFIVISFTLQMGLIDGRGVYQVDTIYIRKFYICRLVGRYQCLGETCCLQLKT
jgi:hypothetical protein